MNERQGFDENHDYITPYIPIELRCRVIGAPLGFKIRVNDEIETNFRDRPLWLRYSLSSDQSWAIASGKSSRFLVEDNTAILQRLVGYVESVFAINTFGTGVGIRIIPAYFRDHEGIMRAPAFKVPTATVVKSFKLPDDMNMVYRLVQMDLDLSIILRELASTVYYGDETYIIAARAIDRIRHAISPGSADFKSSWKKMREHLNIEQDYLEEISRSSAPSRHGDRVTKPLLTTHVAIERAWRVVDRYIAYAIKGRNKLDAAEFSSLTSDLVSVNAPVVGI